LDRAKIDGVELDYEVVGNGEPVVFIHGALIADAFRPLLAEASLASGRRLILYHRRGYQGSSPVSEVVSVSAQAADCRGLLRYLGVERAHVVGHSYGGAVALQLALDWPEIVQTLALLEPALMAGDSSTGYRDALAHGAKRYREADAEVVVEEFLEARCPGHRDVLDRALPEAAGQAVADAGTWFEREMPGLLAWRFGVDEARHISQPTLAVLGRQSNALWPRFGETQRLLLAWLPRAEGFVLPGSTHFLQLEQPRELADALADFIDRHPLSAEAG
jgi:pimeloyl-ACP methyl ester carboxylesterase